MNRWLFALGLLLITATLTSFRADSARRTARFEDMYECRIITDVEVSEYGVDEYEQVECDDFMRVIAKGRHEQLSFYPAWEANLYDDDGMRYKIYISQTGTFFRIDGDSFRLPRRLRNNLLYVISQ